MPRAPGTSTALTGVTGQKAQTIRAFTLESGRGVEAYTTRPGKDRVDGANPLCVIWREHATSDNVRITIWSEPTAQRMQIGGRRHAFVEAAADCKTVAELRALWEEQGSWTLEKFAFASRWVLITIDTPAARQDYARLKAAIEGLPAPVSEDEAEDAPLQLVDESDDSAPLPALVATRATRTTSRRLRSTRRTRTARRSRHRGPKTTTWRMPRRPRRSSAPTTSSSRGTAGKTTRRSSSRTVPRARRSSASSGARDGQASTTGRSPTS